MGIDCIVISIHSIFGGPITKDDSFKSFRKLVYTTVIIAIGVTCFSLCMLDLYSMLYSKDLVLSVIDLLMLVGIVGTTFVIQSSTLLKYFYSPNTSIIRWLDNIDSQLYTLNMHQDPSRSFPVNCGVCSTGTIIITIGYVLANLQHINSTNGLLLVLKSYGLMVIFLMHGLFLVLSCQIWMRIHYMMVHLERMIMSTGRKAGENRISEHTTTRFYRDLKALAIVQSHCFKAVDCLNEECGLANVAIFGLFFYVLTAKCFQLFYVCSIEFKQHGLIHTQILEPIVLILAVFVHFLMATYLGEMVLRETQLVVNNLHKLESIKLISQSKEVQGDEKQSEIIEQLGNQIVHQPVSFTVMNFFQIDLKFFHLVMGSVGTYLIILLQFDFQN
uniref:Gustatory receptor n=1 Tax=Anopheles farauti TaxID=69004 RepID=A0A3F2YX39_9DIPT